MAHRSMGAEETWRSGAVGVGVPRRVHGGPRPPARVARRSRGGPRLLRPAPRELGGVPRGADHPRDDGRLLADGRRGTTSPAPVLEVARIWRDMSTYVCSRTLSSAKWGTTIVREVVPEQVEALKTQPVGLLLLGGEEVGTVFLATTSSTSSGSSSTRSSSGGVGRSATPPTTRDRSPSSRPEDSRTPSSSTAIGGTDRPPGPCWAGRARRRSRPTPGLGRRHANA